MPDLSPFEQLIEQVREKFADESVPFFLYNQHPPEAAPRQVVFIPGKFKSETALEANVGGVGNDTLFVELLIVEVQHHGFDLADTWDIRVRVSNAIRRVFKNSAVPLDGHYTNADPRDENANLFGWDPVSVLVQRYIWKLNVPRLEAGTYSTQVKEIDVVPGTQFTTTVDGVLTPSEQLEIKE